MSTELRRTVQCPGCQTSITLPRSLKGGAKIRCPQCGRTSQLQSVPPNRDAAEKQRRAPVPLVVAIPVDEPPPRSGFELRSMLLGALLVALLMGGGAAAFFFFVRPGGAPGVPANAATDPNATAVPNGATVAVSTDGGVPNEAPAGPPPEIALQAQQILKSNCHRCHGDGGSAEGGLNFILRREKLVAAGGYVIPGNPGQSRLLQRILAGEMPPDDGTKLAAADVEVLKQWIAAGAPEFATIAARPFVSNEQVFEAIRVDLNDNTPERDRRFVRYFTITHLYNAGLSDDEMETYRLALTKLLNSLSWNRQIVQLKPLDAPKTIFRVDLRDLEWTDEVWRKVISADPYAVVHTFAAAKLCQAATDCQVPAVRGDWFVSAASQPPLYYDVMQIPKDKPVAELERLLRTDVAQNIERRRVARAGFNGSGVSHNNRLIERHRSPYGALWVSYDFAANIGRKNLFDHPLGPGTEDRHFQHDGGEIIFNLPNGLQGYLLVDASNNRLDKGPLSIVADDSRPDRAVVNGLSCMSCHYAGIIAKGDSIRANVVANQAAFPESADVLALYPERDEMARLQDEDGKRFMDACRSLGMDRFTKTGEPVVNMARRFEADLDRPLAAAELGLTPEKFATQVPLQPELARVLGILNVSGGTLKREVFVRHFAQAVKAFGLGSIFNEDAGKTPESTTPATPVAQTPANPATPKTPATETKTPGTGVATAPAKPAKPADPPEDLPVGEDIPPTVASNSPATGNAPPIGKPGPMPAGEEGYPADLPPPGTPVYAKRIAELRVWTPTTGDREPFEATYIGVIGDAVVLKKPNGENVRGPISGLCEEDQDYIREMRALKSGRRPLLPAPPGGEGGEAPPFQPGPGAPGKAPPKAPSGRNAAGPPGVPPNVGTKPGPGKAPPGAPSNGGSAPPALPPTGGTKPAPGKASPGLPPSGAKPGNLPPGFVPPGGAKPGAGNAPPGLPVAPPPPTGNANPGR